MRIKTLILYFILMLGTFATYGQNTKKFDIEDYRKKRNEFLKKEMNLTDKEASAFFPLSDDFMKQKYDINRSVRQHERQLKEKKDKTDADYESFLKRRTDAKVKEAQLEKHFYEKFSKVLPPAKLYKYQEAEMKFMRNTVNNKEREKEREKQGEKERSKSPQKK